MKRCVLKIFTTIKEKLRKTERPEMLKLILVFFAVMAGLTIFSRITYNMILPKVVVEQMGSGEISKSITLQGEVGSEAEVPVFTKEGLVVDGIHVSEGQNVSEGEILYTVDREQVERKIADYQSDVTALSNQISQIRMNGDEDTGMSSELESLKAEYDKIGRELQDYWNIKNAGYGICAKKNGVITVINTQVGQTTQGSADMLIAASSSGLAAIATTGTEEGVFIGKNTVVDISSENGTNEKNLQVSSIASDLSQNTFTVRVKLSNEDFFIGQTVTMLLKANSKKYDCCIPRSALNLEGGSYFVFGITEEETILGTENKVIKKPVKLLDKNAEYAAVEGISEGETIIVQSDKIIREDIKVRVIR